LEQNADLIDIVENSPERVMAPKNQSFTTILETVKEKASEQLQVPMT
jgi:hypothetical protein